MFKCSELAGEFERFVSDRAAIFSPALSPDESEFKLEYTAVQYRSFKVMAFV